MSSVIAARPVAEPAVIPFGLYYLQPAPARPETSRGTNYTTTTTSKDGTEEADTDWEDHHFL